jgi:Starch-binding associating with outer membrane
MYKIIKSLIVFSSLLIIVTGCKKLTDFGDTNVDPQAINTPQTSALLSYVETQLGGYANNSIGGSYCQYFSEAEYPSISLYSIPQYSFIGNYVGVLNSAQSIITANNNADEVAVTKIIKSYIFWNVTDEWGDVPYSQSLKGVVPAYDKQMDIYKGMIAELTAAVAQFNNSGALKGDFIYNNDINKWKKAANSMRLMMALRLSKKYPTASDYAATEFKKALAADGGTIETNSDNFSQPFPGGNYKNPFWITHDAARDLGFSAPLGAILTAFGDARINAWGSNPASAEWVPYGFSEGQINTWRQAHPNWSRILAPASRQETSDIVMIGASEVLLARAEAADRGWTTENASALFQSGVNLSFSRWNTPLPSASYFAQTGVAFTAAPGTNANLKQIAYQRYLAAFPNGTQGWSEYRRTGFPILANSPSPSSSAHTTIPRRYIYAVSEFTTNPTGVAAAIANIPGGVDTQESRVWWDQ